MAVDVEEQEEDNTETCLSCGEESEDVVDGYCANCRRDLGIDEPQNS